MRGDGGRCRCSMVRAPNPIASTGIGPISGGSARSGARSSPWPPNATIAGGHPTARANLAGKEVKCPSCRRPLTVRAVPVPGSSATRRSVQGRAGDGPADPRADVTDDRGRRTSDESGEALSVALAIAAVFVALSFVLIGMAAGFGRHYARHLESLLE